MTYRASFLKRERKVLLFANEQEGDNQGVNSNSFGERETDEQIDADERLGFRIAANGGVGLTGGDTNANARSDSSKTDGQCCCKGGN